MKKNLVKSFIISYFNYLDSCVRAYQLFICVCDYVRISPILLQRNDGPIPKVQFRMKIEAVERLN